MSEKVAQFGWKKTVVYSLLPVFLLLAVLEVGARVAEIWLPPWAVDYGWGFTPDSRLYVPSEGDPSKLITNPSKEVSFKKQEFAMPKPEGRLRVFMLGGSSVNYIMYLLRDLAAEVTNEIGAGRQVEIIDSGGLAYGTHRLVPVLSEVLKYDPDLIMIYSGHNEFEEAVQLQLAQVSRLPLQKIVYKSAFCRFLRDRVASIKVSRLQRQKNKGILSRAEADYQSGFSHKYTPAEIEERMAAYRNNLSMIISMCRSKGVPIIIGTVPSNLWKPDLSFSPFEAEVKPKIEEHYAAGRYELGVALVRETLRKSPRHQSSDAENEIIRQLAKDYNVPLADVETAVIKAEPHGVPGETLFSDRCHLNEKGNEILIAAYREKMLELLK